MLSPTLHPAPSLPLPRSLPGIPRIVSHHLLSRQLSSRGRELLQHLRVGSIGASVRIRTCSAPGGVAGPVASLPCWLSALESIHGPQREDLCSFWKDSIPFGLFWRAAMGPAPLSELSCMQKALETEFCFLLKDESTQGQWASQCCPSCPLRLLDRFLSSQNTDI